MDRLPHDISSVSDLPSSTSGSMPSRGVIALRTALQALLRSGAPDDALRRAVALFCMEAKRRELQAEQVLVLLKDVLRTLPEVRRLRRAEREPALARLATLTIRTFYETTSGPADVRQNGEPA